MAHHFDIAKWAMDLDETIPVKVIPPKKGSSGLRMIYENGAHLLPRPPVTNSTTAFYGQGTLCRSGD